MSEAIELNKKIQTLIKEGQYTALEPCERFPHAAAHCWHEFECEALTLALAAGRPLLVRGEAGSGKSQLARAVAALLGAELLVEVLHARFEASDLKYRLDLVRRLADAESGDDATRSQLQDWLHYYDSGIYWQACDHSNNNKKVVLLIDEIDKADSDIPNALLDVLGNGSFAVPYTDKVVNINPHCQPLVIITTNEDRELPAAFVRRCVALNQNPPNNGKDQASFCRWLYQRGQAHDYLKVDDNVAKSAATMVFADRMKVIEQGFPPVGLAEYLDLLRALSDLAANDTRAQKKWLETLRGYALLKQRDLDQQMHRSLSASDNA